MPDAPHNQPLAYGSSDVGLKRERNEDAFLLDADVGLYVVADGMGGHAGGGIASKLAVESIREYLRDALREEHATAGAAPLDADRARDELRQAVEAAGQTIFDAAQADPALTGMGTTVTAALVRGDRAFLAHVGDSRCYLVRDGRIFQLTEDHSLVNEQVKAGAITADEARHSRFKNIITRSVGFEEQVAVDVAAVALRSGDHLLLCCDGLTNLVDDQEILEVVTREAIAEVPTRLISLANDRGGDDNITVVVLRR